MKKRSEIRIRDPFILTDKENRCYYMYGTTDLEVGSLAAHRTFSVYKSVDLENFEEPKVVVDGEKLGFWGTHDYWASEVHKYNGKYYLFGSVNAEGKCRATQIFVCDTPDGEFVPLSSEARTPADWVCLDGTFYVEDGTPYMVFSREWVQVKDGEMWAMPLTEDLSRPAGEPFKLFSASENPDAKPFEGIEGAYITDGPFMFREDGKLKMLWSSFAGEKYLVLTAESDSIHGKWTHIGSRYDFSGGHAMLFEDLNGNRKIALHSPNTDNDERAYFYEF
ncbi:MAG: family 43 glycosylhydrolase [Clostridia bacterium]|nr:family 43 glycosylhydrolase [Clostridia bacterium]